MATSMTTDPTRRPVPRLTNEERTRILNGLDPQVQPFVITVVDVFKVHKDQWKEYRSGVLCFVYDTFCKAYFFMLYTLVARGLTFLASQYIFSKKDVKLVWNFEIKSGLHYHQVEDYFGAFEKDGESWGFRFTNKAEASIFQDIITEYLCCSEDLENSLSDDSNFLPSPQLDNSLSIDTLPPPPTDLPVVESPKETENDLSDESLPPPRIDITDFESPKEYENAGLPIYDDSLPEPPTGLQLLDTSENYNSDDSFPAPPIDLEWPGTPENYLSGDSLPVPSPPIDLKCPEASENYLTDESLPVPSPQPKLIAVDKPFRKSVQPLCSNIPPRRRPPTPPPRTPPRMPNFPVSPPPVDLEATQSRVVVNRSPSKMNAQHTPNLPESLLQSIRSGKKILKKTPVSDGPGSKENAKKSPHTLLVFDVLKLRMQARRLSTEGDEEMEHNWDD